MWAATYHVRLSVICASNVRSVAKLRCAECGRRPREDESAPDTWRAHSDGLSEVHLFCPECHAWEFAPGAQASGLVPIVTRGSRPGRFVLSPPWPPETLTGRA